MMEPVWRLPILVMFVALLAFVLLRRSEARRGGGQRSAQIGHDGISERQSFESVWMQTTPPQAAMNAHKDRVTGTLLTDPNARAATFTGKDGSVFELRRIRAVAMGRRGSDFVNTWVEVRFGDAAPGSTVWLNDGRWLGWGAILTRSNSQIAAALNGLRPEDAADGDDDS